MHKICLHTGSKKNHYLFCKLFQSACCCKTCYININIVLMIIIIYSCVPSNNSGACFVWLQQSGGGGGRGNSLYGSRVSSPSLTLDSGRGSSSAPSSPAKEMSPVPPGSSHLYSPNLSRKMTKSSSAEPTPNRLLLTSRNNSREQLASPLVRKDSLENEIDGLISTNKAAFHHQNKDCSNKSAVIGDLDDLNVPNEVFDEKLEPKEEVPLAMSVSKPGNFLAFEYYLHV